MNIRDLTKQLQDAFGLRVGELTSVSGGDIADSYLMKTEGALYFLKVLGGTQGFKMLQAESEGLTALGAAGDLPVPDVVRCSPLSMGGGALLLEYIPPGKGSNSSYAQLGRGLAGLHQNTSSQFGWECSNYIGTLPQSNSPETDWGVFYARQRLFPLYHMAAASGQLSRSEIPDSELMIARIASMVPEISPSLLHGDLWSGNYLISASGQPYLIDPAVYYGHSEADLAMTLLFGGFPSEFYDAYFEIRPRMSGFEERVSLYQLYYLLVHLNLFGRSYYPRVSEITSRLFGSGSFMG